MLPDFAVKEFCTAERKAPKPRAHGQCERVLRNEIAQLHQIV